MRTEWSFLPLMGPPLPAPPTLIIVVMLAGCGMRGGTTPNLEQIFPASAYSDAPVAVTLLGGPFHPPVSVDTYSGSADVAPAPFQIVLDPLRPIAGRRPVAGINPSWTDDTEIDATLPAGVLAGSYTVSLHDAAGNTISSSSSSLTYTSLGPDIDPPRIVFLQPPAGTTFAPGEIVDVVVRVDDGAGQVSQVVWSSSPPALSPQATDPTEICVLDSVGVCRFQVRADPGPDVVDGIDIRVDAEDEVHNHATADRRVQVASIPTVDDLYPTVGSTAGGTTIRVYGSGLVQDLSQITVDGVAIGGLVDAQGVSIAAATKAHPPGGAMIAVSNGHSVSATTKAFTFIPPPILKLIDPPDASAASSMIVIGVSGNYFRPETQFSWIQAGNEYAIPYAPPANDFPPLPYERLETSTRVSLVLVPPVKSQPFTPGPISIRARDPISGDFTLVDAFRFDAAP